MDYKGTPTNSDGDDQVSLNLNKNTKLKLFFFYEESQLNNDYIIRVYPEWAKTVVIARSDNSALSTDEARETGGWRWGSGSYTVPSVAGTYKIKVVYSGSIAPPTWDSYDSLLAEATIVVLPDKGNLKVLVKDGGGTLVSGVSVSTTKQPSGQTTLTGTTDSTGSLTFNSVLIGNYTIFASKEGYASNTASCKVDEDKTSEITIITNKNSSIGLPSIYLIPVFFLGILISIVLLRPKNSLELIMRVLTSSVKPFLWR